MQLQAVVIVIVQNNCVTVDTYPLVNDVVQKGMKACCHIRWAMKYAQHTYMTVAPAEHSNCWMSSREEVG